MLKQKKSFMEEYKYIILSFLATAGTMLVIFMINRMVPLGRNTILRMDLYHQYGPLFAELYERLTNGDSLLYSWNSGLGSSFLGNYFNYLSSPLSAIVVFFGHKNITEAIAAMILIKAALSSSTFTYFIKRSLHSQSWVSCAFGVMYSFCGYMLAYYWNVMWLDAMVLLPIVLLGIERIIDNGKMKTFIIGLALSMFSNYYMSYMLCIFSCIYFFYYFFKSYTLSSKVDSRKRYRSSIKNNRFLRSGIIFTVAALTSAGLMAAVLLPVYKILKSCSATSGTFPTDTTSYFTFFDFFANHLASLTTTIRSSGDDVLPNVYCGILTIILAPLFFFTKTISKKEKVVTLGLLTALYFSFNSNILNYIWHGFHFPNDLPYRQSFIYSFVLLVMAYKVFLRLNEFSSKHFGAVGAFLVIFVMMTEELTSKNVTNGTILLTLILIVLYVLILTIFKDKKYETLSVAALLVVCICSEAIMCDSSTISISINKDSYVSDYDDFEVIKDSLDTIEDGEFYRMELADLRTRMDPSWFYYNGASVFSSMAYEKLSNLQDDLGMMSNRINSYTYNPQTPVYNMMFSMKYIVNNYTSDFFRTSPTYSQVASYGKYTAYRNEYYLPIAYCVDPGVISWADEEYLTKWKTDTNSDAINLQGDYFNLATGGAGNPFEKMDISYVTYSNIKGFVEPMSSTNFYFEKMIADTDGSVTLSLVPQTDTNVYIYFEIYNNDSKDLTINTPLGVKTHSLSHDHCCVLDLGYYNAGDTITVTIPFEENNGSFKFFAYTLNKEIMDKGYNILNEASLFTEEFDDTYIKGRFTATKDSLLYTSIPYDAGWQVYLDGERVPEEKIVKIGDALLGVIVDEGNHDVEFRYSVPMLKEGLLISAITLLMIAAYYLLKKLNKSKERIHYQPINQGYSEYIFFKTKEDTAPEQETEHTEICAGLPEYPVKEIISPRVTVHKEIINPPKFNITEIDSDNQ